MDTIATDEAPQAIGPYSQAIRAGNLVFCSGQLGINPTSGQLAETVEAQTQQALKNLTAVLKATGLSPANVTKTTIFLADMNDFKTVNTLYAEAFGAHKPARATVQVARLPLDARVEIDCIAVDA
jgi:2-iminobutanoate/2-iminopropanoate deaminase